MTADKIKQHYSRLKKAREKTENWWKHIAEYLIPELGELRSCAFFDQKRSFSSAGALALRHWREGLQGYFVNPAMPWFRLRLVDNELNEYPEVKEYMQECEKQLYSLLQNSGFYDDSLELFFTDAGALGNGCTYLAHLVKDNRFRIVCEPIENIYFGCDYRRQIDTVYRKFTMTARAAAKAFQSPHSAIIKAAEQDSEQEFEFLHAIIPNGDIDISKADERGKPYLSIYLDMNNNHICEFAGDSSLKAHVWRVRTVGGESWGVGPGYDALIDIQKHQQISKDELETAQLNMYPPLKAPAALRGRMRLQPKGITYYDDVTMQPIEPIYTGSNYTIGAERVERIEQIIKQHFRVDFFLMLNSIDRSRTATEVLELQGEKAAMMGSMANSLSNYLDGVIESLFMQAMDNELMPPPPEVLLERAAQLQIEYVGPLAQAQKRYFQSQGIKAGLAELSPLIGAFPQVADILDFDIAARELLEANGFPQKAIRAQDVVEAMRQQRQQQQAEQQMMEQAATAGRANRDLSVGAEANSPMDMIAQTIGLK